MVAGEPHGRHHVGGAAASGDQPGTPGDGPVPDGSRGVVVGVVSGDQLSPEPIDLHGGFPLARWSMSPSARPLSTAPIASPRTPTVKSRIWTSRPTAGARHWRRADLRPVLPHRPWRRDLRRALDAADHPQPVPGLRKLQRNPGRRARALAHSAVTAAQAARTVRHRRIGTQTRRARVTTSSRPRVTTSSRSVCHWASGVPPGSRSPPSTSIPLWLCGRCATCSAETGSQVGASLSVSTSRAANAPSGTDC
jgi:hypothetical protein